MILESNFQILLKVLHCGGIVELIVLFLGHCVCHFVVHRPAIAANIHTCQNTLAGELPYDQHACKCACKMIIYATANGI